MKVLPCSNNRTDANKQIIDEEFQGFADDTYFYFFNGNVIEVGASTAFNLKFIYSKLYLYCIVY